jgi:hypothetical protein
MWPFAQPNVSSGKGVAWLVAEEGDYPFAVTIQTLGNIRCGNIIFLVELQQFVIQKMR